MIDEPKEPTNGLAVDWDTVLAEGERSIEEEGTLDGEEAYQQHRAERKKRFPR